MIVVGTDEPERSGLLLGQLEIPFTREPGRILISPQAGFTAAEINALLVRDGIAVSELTTRHLTLEDAFLDLTSAGGVERKETSLIK